MTSTEQTPPSQRKDAQRHRQRLVDAAATVFFRDGWDAALDLVIRESGLGRGTLYRHFPARGSLVAAVLRRELDRMVDFVGARRGSPTLLRDFLQEHALVGLMAASAMDVFGTKEVIRLLHPSVADATRLYQTVIDDAIAAGTLDRSFDLDDFMLVMRMAIAAGNQATSEAERKHWISRGLDMILGGLAGYRPPP